eukprot:272116_1
MTMVEMDTQFEKDWMNHIKAIDTILLHTEHIQNETMFEELQKKKIEIKRGRDEYVAVTNKTKQSMIHLNEPIVKQREKEKHELRSETTRKEECLRNIKNQIETKQNDLNKTKQNESILNAKNNETQMEFKRMMKQFETKKEDLIRITKQLRKIRKESKGLTQARYTSNGAAYEAEGVRWIIEPQIIII